MARDVYEPCVCGSGRKLKFCCYRAISDIERIERLLDNRQNRLALQALDELLRRQPDNRWALIERAELYGELGRLDDALADVERLLTVDESHPSGAILLAKLRFERDGYWKARGAIQRAFQKFSRKEPDFAASLAVQIAMKLGLTHAMASRRYLALATELWEDEELQRETFLLLVRLEGETAVPYPLRGPRELLPPPDDTEAQGEFRTAMKLAQVGCFDAAATLFRKLAEQSPEDPRLWYNAGICHAWDANPKRAGEALHRAAQYAEDFEDAVEWETLAQLLDIASDEHLRGRSRLRFVPCHSASRLISALQDRPLWMKSNDEEIEGLPKLPTESEDDPGKPVAVFTRLDKPLPESVDESTPPEKLPRTVATAMVLSSESGAASSLLLITDSDELADEVCDELREIAADVLDFDEVRDTETSPFAPISLFPTLQDRPVLPPGTSRAVAATLSCRWTERAIEHDWMTTPQPWLEGLSPDQARQREDLRVSLAAAVNVLDSVLIGSYLAFDVPEMRRRLGLQPPAPISLDEHRTIQNLTSLQLMRLEVENLSDDDFRKVLRRALFLHHSRLSYRAFREATKRNVFLEEYDAQRVYKELVSLCVRADKREEALEWIERARQTPETGPEGILKDAVWELEEVLVRMGAPDDPELRPLLVRMWQERGAKLPEVRPLVQGMAHQIGLHGPWDASVDETTGQVGHETSSGLWVPSEAAEADDASEKKLWVPGED
ncbi:MAG: hypothetical protein GXP27_16250 [Planctomycetes bacterium]|nr:hypothetical protein [Planctomycetota bacterium]